MILLTWFYNSWKQDGAEAQIIREVSLRVFSTGIPASWNAGKGQCMFEKKKSTTEQTKLQMDKCQYFLSQLKPLTV